MDGRGDDFLDLFAHTQTHTPHPPQPEIFTSTWVTGVVEGRERDEHLWGGDFDEREGMVGVQTKKIPSLIETSGGRRISPPPTSQNHFLSMVTCFKSSISKNLRYIICIKKSVDLSKYRYLLLEFFRLHYVFFLLASLDSSLGEGDQKIYLTH